METSEIRIVFFRLQNHLLFIFEQLYGNPTSDKSVSYGCIEEAMVMIWAIWHVCNQKSEEF